MSIEPNSAQRLLRGIYPERRPGDWETVAECLDALVSGAVIPLDQLATAALSADDERRGYSEVQRRAAEMTERQGEPGAAEVEALSLAAVTLGVETSPGLATHVARVGFDIDPEGETAAAIALCSSRVDQLIAVAKQTSTLAENPNPGDAAGVSQALERLGEEQARQNRAFACLAAAATGQMDVWVAVEALVVAGNHLYPFAFELTAAMACVATWATDGNVAVHDIPPPPSAWAVDWPVHAPLLSELSAGSRSSRFEGKEVPVRELARQLLLEILYVRRQSETNE